MNRPGIGIGVFICHNDSVLMSFRKDNNLLALPGGHLEKFEELSECAIREVKEETNLDIENPQLFSVQNTIRKELDHHYVVIFMKDKHNPTQQIIQMEPHKHGEWIWVNRQMFQEYYDQGKLFYGLVQLIKEYGDANNLYTVLNK